MEPNCKDQNKSILACSPLNVTAALLFAILYGLLTSCSTTAERQSVQPHLLRDVPARRLAYRFEPDAGLPAEVKIDEANDKSQAIQADFDTRRQDNALLRTVVSPDGQRALALYGTSDESSASFHIDMYAADGKFLRNVTPPDLAGAFPTMVAWTSDGNYITFIGHKAIKPTPTPTAPTDIEPVLPSESPLPSVSIAPAFPAVALFNTEQIYICNRDGYDLKPLTAREGLIYFYFSWAPDNHALVALACKEDEWDARERQFKLPAGRARLISREGKERLLDDKLTEALPVWSPDSSKVAIGFDADVGIYDAATSNPTQARTPLRDALIAASIAYEEKTSKKKSENAAGKSDDTSSYQQSGRLPASFNPIVRLEWPSPEKLYIQTAYVRLIPNEPINTFQRWHLLVLSPQAALIK
jgi:hypothetical protein